MEEKGPFTVEASGYEKVDGETLPRRHPAAKVCSELDLLKNAPILMYM